MTRLEFLRCTVGFVRDEHKIIIFTRPGRMARPSLKFRIVCFFSFLFVILSRTLIGSRAVFRSRACDVLSTVLFQFECNGNFNGTKVQNDAFGLGRSVQAQVDSDKLTNELHSMHKCTKTKKLGNVKEAFRHRYFLKHYAVYFEDVNLNCDPRVGFE